MDAQDFRSLQEAYIGVYDDDIREKLQFESWVNNLLEEGYDLSDYTWEELYENYTQLDEISDRRVQKTLQARERRFNRSIDSGAPNKEFHQLRKTEKLVASRNKRTGSNIKVDENHQLDELSVNKMHDYINKAEKDRSRLNKKWDQGTATSKERKKVFDREEGEARASKKIRQKTGKDSFRLNALDKLKSAITKESYDIFDAILEHLIAEGYADTNESALVIMANMSEEWRNSIVEVKLDPRGRIASGPMNVYANPKGKPSQARLDAIKAYDAEEKKKTPEQRSQELADYKERQMNR